MKYTLRYTEAVDWLIPNPPTDDDIKQALAEIAVQGVEGFTFAQKK